MPCRAWQRSPSRWTASPVPAAAVSFSAPSTWSFTFTPTQNGQTTYTIGVTATDKAGNSASDSISVLGVKTGKP